MFSRIFLGSLGFSQIFLGSWIISECLEFFRIFVFFRVLFVFFLLSDFFGFPLIFSESFRILSGLGFFRIPSDSPVFSRISLKFYWILFVLRRFFRILFVFSNYFRILSDSFRILPDFLGFCQIFSYCPKFFVPFRVIPYSIGSSQNFSVSSKFFHILYDLLKLSCILLDSCGFTRILSD